VKKQALIAVALGVAVATPLSASLPVYTEQEVTAYSEREAAGWDRFHSCLVSHVSDVSRLVEGMDEGAELIIQSLCQDEATDLINIMTQDREVFCGGGRECTEREFVQHFNSARTVVERGVKHELYRRRLRDAPQEGPWSRYQ
jgi:hypothetical protein